MGEMVPCISMTLQLPHCGVEDGVSLNVYMLRHRELGCGTDSSIWQHWQEGFHATLTIVSCNSVHVCIGSEVELLVRRRKKLAMTPAYLQCWQRRHSSSQLGESDPQEHAPAYISVVNIFVYNYESSINIFHYIPFIRLLALCSYLSVHLYIFLSSCAW